MNNENYSKDNKSERIFTVSLRPPALIAAIVLLIGGLIWTFVLGIMVGRGYMADQLEAANNSDGNQTSQTTSADSAAEAKEQLDKIINDELIRKQDLDYDATLRAQAQPQQNTTTPAETAPRSAAPPANHAPLNPALITSQTGPAANIANGSIYSFVFQAASFSKENQAQELSRKFSKDGIDNMVEEAVLNNATWYRVIVLYQGTEGGAEELKTKVNSAYKINIMLRKKSILS